MTHPTDDELEAMAVLLEAFGTRTGLKDAAAAMLRACKAGDALRALSADLCDPMQDERVKALVDAIVEYMEHDADYSTINKLGDHTQSHRWKRARAALRALE